ncbi:MAG TPA: hypothetical protein PKD45_13640 [Flavobacteriales bacterium]|nr:hypothetical protein [Flavobacteriales bacterium]
MTFPIPHQQRIESSLLQPLGSDAPGMCMVFRAELGQHVLKTLDLPEGLRRLWDGDLEQLREVAGLPDRPMLVIPGDRVHRSLWPRVAPLRLSLALLALSSPFVYDPARPVVFTKARLQRRIILCVPHRFHEL